MLEEIVAAVERRLPDLIARRAEFDSAASGAARRFTDALTAPGLSVIAEVKRRSPSRGDLRMDLDPAGRALLYARGGASAISVLTERDHFAGSPADLRAARGVVDLPLLRKDFLLHPVQVWESVAIGADAVLLIAAILDDARLGELLREATTAGLAVLVEAHSEAEVERAQHAGAAIIGVNNRDLATFDVDLSVAERLASRMGEGVIRVAESGMHTRHDAERMAAAGYDAVLVGESLVRAQDPAALIQEMRVSG